MTKAKTPEEHIKAAESLLDETFGWGSPTGDTARAMAALAHIEMAKFKRENETLDYDSWDM